MAEKKLRKRSEIPQEFKWDVEAIYPDENELTRDLDEITLECDELLTYEGRLTESASTLLGFLKGREKLIRKVEKAYVYSHLKKDEDTADSTYVALNGKCMAAYVKAEAALSFAVPELLKCPEETIYSYIDENEDLKEYEFMLKDILREKEHILSGAEESLLAQLSEVTHGFSDIFGMLNNADMKFGEIENEDGETVPVTHGSYTNLMRSYDRNVRKEAYSKMYESYKALINTIAATYNYSVKKSVVNAGIRKYESARQASLSSNNIPESVYDNLISVVHEYLPELHRYTKLRKKILGVDELKMYDIYTPLVKMPKVEIAFDDALKLCREALTPMGEEYIEIFDKGTLEDGWIDIYENEGKRSGAYSSGCYDTKPYVLLNYDGKLDDVFTVIHEMGHSIHSYYSNHNQPYTYADYSIFVAEVASTVNESLLILHRLETEKDPEMRRYLINHYIEQFRTTLFRQTMFAEFEKLTHDEVENGGVLTADWLCDKYDELNRAYYGDALGEDEYIKYEWARIPHFYTDFYVYQYATGFSAATAFSGMIKNGEPGARDRYIDFLKSGSSDYPVEVLKKAGVDMSSPEPVRKAMETFKMLVDEFEKLL